MKRLSWLRMFRPPPEAQPARSPFADTAYRLLFESSSEVVVIAHASGRIVDASRRARELLGWGTDANRKLLLTDYFSRPALEVFQKWLEGVTKGESNITLKAQLASGSEVHVALRRCLAGGHIALTLEENSLAQQAERQRRQLEAELRSVLDAVQCGVLLVSPEGRIRFTSARFRLLFALDPNALRDLQEFDELAQLMKGRFRGSQDFSAPWKSFVAGSNGAARDELELAGPPRRVFQRFSRPILDAEGQRLGWLEVYEDITSQRHIQSKLLHTEKMAALGQLVSGIAHELNNPLTSIMGYAQLLLGRSTPETPGTEARNIFHEAERARRIVKNLLFFSRQAEPERLRVDVNQIVERTVALRGYELKIENIAVACTLEPDLPATLADPYQLQQVVLNLLVNAEQAILEGRGRGCIRVCTKKTPGSRLAIEVADDGPGIPVDIASRIFDPFFTTKPPGVGTGLGLSIVYGIVHQHGGEVTFENRRSGGAKFTVELPIQAAPAVEPAPPLALPDAASGKMSAGCVLVVEDEPTVAQLIADVLREEGHQVEAVLDSQEGLARVARNRYDLVICDLRMPRLDGPAFYDVLVRTGSPARHRILFITGDTLGPRTMEFLKSRQLPFLAKPFLVEELKLAVNRVLSGDSSVATASTAGANACG